MVLKSQSIVWLLFDSAFFLDRLDRKKSFVLPEFSVESGGIFLQERLGWFWWQCLNSRHLVRLELISLMWRQTGGRNCKVGWSSFCLLFIHAFTKFLLHIYKSVKITVSHTSLLSWRRPSLDFLHFSFFLKSP